MSARRDPRNGVDDRAQLLQEVLASSTDIVFIKDANGRYIAGNKAHADLCGVREEEVLGKTDWELHGDTDDARYALETDRQVLLTGEPYQATGLPIEFRGRERWFDLLKSPLHDRNGEIAGTIGIARDITRLHEAEQRLASGNAWLEQLNATTATMIQNQGVDVDYVPLIKAAMDWIDSTSVAVHLWSAELDCLEEVATAGRSDVDTETVRTTVADVWAMDGTRLDPTRRVLATPIDQADERIGVLVLFDGPNGPNEIRHAEAAAGQLATLISLRDLLVQRELASRTDQLTGLGNRRLFTEQLDAAVTATGERTGRLALIFMDLDGFKEINDNYGHQEGDRALQHVADCLQGVIRDGDTLARIGGDEFAVVAPGLGPAGVEALRARIDTALRERGTAFALGPGSIGLSLGAAFAPTDATDAETLLMMADSAMYEAKRASKAQASRASV